MIHITDLIENEQLYKSKLMDFYFRHMRIAAVDIETTGLNPSRNKFVLGGIMDLETKVIHQYFAENRSEESEALSAFIDELSNFDMVITYNGKHFDLPFIQKRADHYEIPFESPYNLDLYLVLNGHSPIKNFVPNLKQKTVENYMGLWQTRTDEISGAESVELYNLYEKSGDQKLRDKILLHNSDDVLQLARLMKVLAKCDMNKALYTLGFPVSGIEITKIRTEMNNLIVSGMQRRTYTDYMGFTFGNWPVESRLSTADKSFLLKIPLIRHSGLSLVDIYASGIDPSSLMKFPTFNEGFLILENKNKINHFEINSFIKAFVEHFMNTICK